MTAELVTALLIHYSFDLGGYTSSELIAQWFHNYPEKWVRAAVIEALYRGRYKAVSIDQILAVWQRRGDALHHFTHDFERLVCANLPDTLVELESTDNSTHYEQMHFVAAANPLQNSSVMVVKPTTITPHVSRSTHEVRSPTSSNYSPIVRFTPPEATTSDFHAKLKAISRSAKNKQSESLPSD
ncbi:hypothetical protein IQ230_12020 [Gloeocapsopsis crepidinum LEGE 06123]|uniref:DnaD domain-containing protein n=1 Tax=Gloeocapsopsis crepidinum LEGE 06123 TaxID=588587 RepID=A0ABR9US14_9CHRO|nr:hypothetical protein [Gloeocapsopsis crepidinum]MBE9191066.1 hypothetical protein [Gloeocapsopsis crepidinum LEGE 06123]